MKRIFNIKNLFKGDKNMAKSKIIFKKNKTNKAVENYIPDEEKKKLPTYDPAKLKDVKKEIVYQPVQ